MRSKIIQILFIIVLSIYIFYGFDIEKIHIEKFSFLGVFLTFIIIIIAQLVLSLRWMKMSALSFKISLETIIVSSALNMILPAKLGELSKAIYLKKFYNFNYHKSISIIFIERFFDIIVLFLLLCIWIYNYSSNEVAQSTSLILAVFITTILLLLQSKKTLYYVKKIPLQFLRVYLQKIYHTIRKMFQSLLSLSFYTLLLWSVYFLTSVVFYSFAINFQLNYMTLLGLFIFSTVALAIPLTPAGIGTYEGAVILFLSLHGVNKEDAFLAASLHHILLFIVDFTFLYLFLVLKNLKFKELVQS